MKLKNALTVGLAALALGSAASAFADGIIIPAYLPLTDTTNWNILKEDAALFASGSSTSYKDYYVVVTGPDSGPFTAAADWQTAKTVWDPITANSGKIVGYVHTLVTPTGTTFRPLPMVEGEVKAWVTGYGSLSGIWIDEFNPRFEIAGPNDSSLTFPNRRSLAPTDRSFINSNGTFNGGQVNPYGGYYSQLIRWIHINYPTLTVFANPGSQFYSNQARYASLADVTCSFENTFAAAANSPKNNWNGLNQLAGTLAYPQAALIHTNTTDLNGAIDQSIAHGYKYFFTTDRTLSTNVWGGLPSYFTSEVTYIANHG